MSGLEQQGKTKKKRTMAEVSISIVADDEFRLTYKDKAGQEQHVQKVFSAKPGPESSHFTFAQMLEVASIIHDSSGLQTEFKENIKEIGWVLFALRDDNPFFKNRAWEKETSGKVDVSNIISDVLERAEGVSTRKPSRNRRQPSRKRSTKKRNSRRRGSRRRPSRTRNR